MILQMMIKEYKAPLKKRIKRKTTESKDKQK